MAPTFPFELINAGATGPVVVSVPHGGRDYPAALLAMLRAPVEKLVPLEDRMVDRLTVGLNDVPVLIARTPRAWIDLNRHEGEIDPGLVDGVTASRLMLTPKVRSGLGLVPRRLAGTGELWRNRLALADVEARIAEVHRPYHAAVAGLLTRATDAHGVAILLDLHSMPPLARSDGQPPTRIVVGTRFGHTAAPWLAARIGATCARLGISWRENSPYAGGHIVERHGAPRRGVHAVQLEVDRSLYLDAAMIDCDPAGARATAALVAAVIADLTAAALDSALPLAAE